ncbi:MAG: MFS transporter [Chloroflexota bacterium]
MTHLRAALANPAIRRVVLAYATFNFAEWATWIAVLVYAYDRGGATESGVVAFTMLVPAAFAAPVIATIGARLRRERMLLTAYVVQALVMAAAAAALFAGAPSAVVYLLATLTSVSVTFTRPAHGAILPSLAATPDELTAANVASGTVQNVSIAAAPVVAGLVLAGPGAGAVFLLSAAGVALGAALIAGVRTAPDEAVAGDAATDVAPPPTRAAEIVDGLRLLARLRGPRTVVALIGSAAIIEGAIDVLTIVVAIDLLALGPAAVGVLTSAAGLGGVIGAAAAVTLVGRARLAGPFAVGLLLWGVPIGVLGLAPGLATGLLLFLIAGVGRGGLDVAGRTLLQRVTPDAALAGAFGAVEAAYMGMIAVGSIAVPVLITIFGPHAALVAFGLWLPLVVVASWRTLTQVDAAGVVHVRELQLLRAIPMFAPLGPPTIERLSSRLVPIAVPAGTWVIREGDAGDRFYIVDAGSVQVEIRGEVVREQGPGSSFGEIALLRAVPRTASVRALTGCRLLALERDVFLSTVAGHAPSRTAADAIIAERLGSG